MEQEAENLDSSGGSGGWAEIQCHWALGAIGYGMRE